jgi:hypothetical protein
LLYINATDNIQVSGAIIDVFDQYMLAIWKFSCNSFFKAIFNSRTYISSPSVKLRIKGVKQLLKKST